MSVARFIANALRIAAEDLAGAKALAAIDNRNAGYLCEQSAEKVIRAVLTSEGIRSERKDQHRLSVLVELLPEANPLKPALKDLRELERFATTYRYVTDAGRIPERLGRDEFDVLAGKLQAVIESAARSFGVDLRERDQPAANVGPIR